ncbi:putative polygalacturonate 4-alpha-galacturonosyltransferase [Rosa chinensis]|uniref:Hexosyltransferase n=1 Tax=Rosa chinensis TaxID=74649 RepID=A0A2P6PVK7_ROSCH|nr:probable galacturonosyltransferase 6 isoform X1 [Rosa chinensis]PRQ25962.1 putative polygalacturonate 4-alpha-galacturonosyltransferase [Rosa chinensis]
MKPFRRCQRILILSLLSLSVFAPILFVSQRLKNLTYTGRKEFIEDLSNVKYRADTLKLSAVEQEAGEGLKEPRKVLYEDTDVVSSVSYSLGENQDGKESGNVGDITDTAERMENVSGTNNESKEGDIQFQQREISSASGEKGQINQELVQHVQNEQSQSRKVIDQRIKEMKDVKSNHPAQKVNSNIRRVADKINEMKDQMIRAKAYMTFAPPNSQLVKELRLRTKEVERVVGRTHKDSDLSRSALQKMRNLEASLSKASRAFPDCSAMATKLRSMTHSAEEQVGLQKKQVTFLYHLAGSTTPKGLHCLSMQLTAEYFALDSEERQFPNQHKLQDPHLYHYAVFSDNVLACAVVVNSTVSTAMEPEKIVFHVVTDSLNFPALSMWFLLNPPGKATIQVQSIESFEWLSTKYKRPLIQKSTDPRYASELNHLRFYLPDIFPALNKIVLFDHDVVVQRDLSRLWSVNMKGKVNGAVETCRDNEPSFLQMDTFINFSDPYVANRFDVNACTWAFGMNLFDLQNWRRHKLTTLYHKYMQLGSKKPLWVAGSLPLGWVTFYNRTVALDRRWHALGLGYDSGVVQGDVDRAAVIHYDGIMKPWLDIAIGRYKGYWSKYLNYDHSHLQRCNIHA